VKIYRRTTNLGKKTFFSVELGRLADKIQMIFERWFVFFRYKNPVMVGGEKPQ